MTQKQYKRSLIWQMVFMTIGLIIILSNLFTPITISDVFFIVVCIGIEIVEEIKQQFYLLKHPEDE